MSKQLELGEAKTSAAKEIVNLTLTQQSRLRISPETPAGMDAAPLIRHNDPAERPCANPGQNCPQTVQAEMSGVMKHPSSREFFAYWNEKRGEASAPDRSDIEPSALRDLLADVFVLAYDAPAGYPFRVAGTRVCARFGRDLKNASFSALFRHDARREIEEIVAIVAEETLPAIGGLSATSHGGTAHLELLLLPFSIRAHTPISLTGLIAPLEADPGMLSNLALTSWRYLHQPERILPRVVRKLAIARGFVVYEGLR